MVSVSAFPRGQSLDQHNSAGWWWNHRYGPYTPARGLAGVALEWRVGDVRMLQCCQPPPPPGELLL